MREASPRTLGSGAPTVAAGLNLKGVTRVLYRLPELLNSTKGIIVCEGEKDADAPARLALPQRPAPGCREMASELQLYFVGARCLFCRTTTSREGNTPRTSRSTCMGRQKYT